MPARYLIRYGGNLTGQAHLDAALKRFGLMPIMATEAINIWASEDLPIIRLDNDRGVILGEIYDPNEPFDTISELSSETWSAVLRTDDIESLTRTFWGNYIAVLVKADRRTVTIARGPYGQLPSYYCRNQDSTLIFSEMSVLNATGLSPASLDWSRIVAHLIAPNLRANATCLSGIHELIGGFGMSIDRDGPRLFEAWNPWSYTAAEQIISDEREAIRRLRSCIDAAVKALARKTTRAVLGVSGGLDSSIVAAVLASNGTPVSCLTLFTKDTAGDERTFARALADHLGLQLFETLEEPANVDLTHSDAAHLPRPVARAFAQSGNQSNLAVARQTGADSFFSGGGGDNVFCSLQSSAPVADCILVGRFGDAWRTSQDMARIANCSIWAVLRSGIKRAAVGSRTYLWRPDFQFLDDFARSAAADACTPLWSATPRDALPGKATHIAWLVGIMNHIEGYGRERTHRMVWPLLAQPIVELCLRIPSQMWSRGGINRGLVRRAYADALPAQVLARHSKGTPDCFVAELFEARRELIRELLCEGILASQGIINRDQIHHFLADETPVRDLAYWRIMTLTDVEAWVRSQSHVARAV